MSSATQWMELAWLVPLLPLLAAGAVFAFGTRTPLRGSGISIGAVAASFALSVGIAWQALVQAPVEPVERVLEWAPLGDGLVLELGILVDGLTAMMLLLVTLVSLTVQVYSREYMADEPRFTYFFGMLSLFTFSMLLLVVANNTLQALVGWELVGICSYLLIGFYWEGKHNQDSANKAFLTTKFADVGLTVGIITLSAGMMAATDTTTPFNIPETVELAAAGGMTQSTIVAGALFMFLGAVGKSGQMPLHVWLPDAMAGPTPVSALIHAATMVTAGVFLVARLYPIFAQSLAVLNTMAVVGTVTLLLAGLLALVQDDVKRVLAYSTVSQLGYMVAALGVGGYTAGIFHLFTHGFFKALLFLAAGSLIHAVHSNNMSDMGGMRRFMPVTFATFIIGSLALAGFPLTAGFFSKDEVLVAGLAWAGEGMLTGNLVFWVGLAGAFVTALYMGRACLLIFWGDNRSETVPHESGPQITLALSVLAALSLVGGLIGSPFWPHELGFEQWTATPALESFTYPFLAEAEALHGPPELHLDVTLTTLLLIVAAVTLAWRWYGRGLPSRDPMLHLGAFSNVLVNKYWVDQMGYRWIVVPVRDQLSRAAYWTNQQVLDGVVDGVGAGVRRLAFATYDVVDQRVVDGGVNGAAFSAAWWSERFKRIQSGDVQRYAGALITGTILLVLVFAVSA